MRPRHHALAARVWALKHYWLVPLIVAVVLVTVIVVVSGRAPITPFVYPEF